MRIVRLLRQIDDHAAARDVDLVHDRLERRYEQFAPVRAARLVDIIAARAQDVLDRAELRARHIIDRQPDDVEGVELTLFKRHSLVARDRQQLARQAHGLLAHRVLAELQQHELLVELAALDVQHLIADHDFLHASKALDEVRQRDDAQLAVDAVHRANLADRHAVFFLISRGWR